MSEVSSSAAAGVDNCRILGLVTLGTTWGCGGGVGGVGLVTGFQRVTCSRSWT